jgi:hypothetical protein
LTQSTRLFVIKKDKEKGPPSVSNYQDNVSGVGGSACILLYKQTNMIKTPMILFGNLVSASGAGALLIIERYFPSDEVCN